MSELREAAQSISAWAVECDGDLVDVCLTEIAAQLVMENRREANRGRDFAWRVVPLVPHTHPPRGEWREASEPPEDDRSVLVWMQGRLGGLAIGRCSRGNWSPYFLGSPVTHWRDIDPPTGSPIAAKCQRIEGSGEICGLTPPCPDCGSSLIDVAEGA